MCVKIFVIGNIFKISFRVPIYQMSVEALLMASAAVSLLETEADLGLIEVGSQARRFSRAELRTLHHFNRSSRVSAINKWRIVVKPFFLSWKKIVKRKCYTFLFWDLFLVKR